MKDLIQSELGKEKELQRKRLVLAECLQHAVLQSLYRHGAFKQIVFTGGTALKLLYHTNRYSEDLDFSLDQKKGFRVAQIIERVQNDLKLQQLYFDYRLREVRTVSNVDMRFPELLHEFHLSPLRSQKLTVKVEIDKNPPQGGSKQMMLVTSPLSYTVSTFDLPSLFATKLHAVFFRKYTKGRDYYDLVWYLGKRVKPNMNLLNNAILQTHGKAHQIEEGELRRRLLKHLESVDFSKVRRETERFMIHPEEAKFLDLEPVKSLLRHYE